VINTQKNDTDKKNEEIIYTIIIFNYKNYIALHWIHRIRTSNLLSNWPRLNCTIFVFDWSELYFDIFIRSAKHLTVCVCACARARAYTHTHTHTHARTRTDAHKCTNQNIFIHIPRYIYFWFICQLPLSKYILIKNIFKYFLYLEYCYVFNISFTSVEYYI